MIKRNTEEGSRIINIPALDSDSFEPFNKLTYSITGDDLANNYFEIDSNGVITLKNSINTRTETVYRVNLHIFIKFTTEKNFIYFFKLIFLDKSCCF